MAHSLKLCCVINSELRLVHNKQTNLIVVKLYSGVTHWGWGPARLRLDELGFPLLPAVSSPNAKLQQKEMERCETR
jgi:hypothetical protein